ncbi:MAG TPA: ATP-binding protein [Beijerinckiaceae bacterium]|jgi:two-component system osmolarity sensor histidine kinase EnvZ|nr:ATP-binding protein [Beijerinckiaceae bacterium]
MSITLPAALAGPHRVYRDFALWLRRQMPKGLYARALLIVILPMVLLQSAVVFFFMERHWQLVTFRLSAALTQDIAALIDIYQSYPQDKNYETLQRIAAERLRVDVDILPPGPLPPALPKPFFSIVDRALSNEIRRQIGRPFWLDTVGRSDLIEIRIQLENAVMRIIAHRSQAYASNSHIFVMWMLGTSLVLILVAIAFLRNQIKPILRLARAAEAFGKGRQVHFRPQGAREVRQAGHAFVEMKRRVERAIEQRTTMLNGVSHDLRTVLTRFRLSLAVIGDTPETRAMQKDLDEMQRMIEAYLAFARGDGGEISVPSDVASLLRQVKEELNEEGHDTQMAFSGDPIVSVRPDAFKRCVANLVANAQRHAGKVTVDGSNDKRFLTINVDDDGPGIPAEQREDVFKPFFRLDEARNQDEAGTGLGLAIARDIARSHGGDIQLATSPLGGLRATLRIPL